MSQNTNTPKASKQELFKALMLADTLEQLPSGRIISILKAKLEPEDLLQGVNFINEKIWEVFLKNCPEPVLEKMDQLLTDNKTEEYQQLISSFIIFDSTVDAGVDLPDGKVRTNISTIVNNTLDFYGKVFARIKNVSLEI